MPVISVGNLTWGGNGKTPMVEFIANYLADSGISPLILTRVLYVFVDFAFECVDRFHVDFAMSMEVELLCDSSSVG